MEENDILPKVEKNKLYLRAADENDMDLLFQWVNDPDVRENSFHLEPISYETHKNWFVDHLSNAKEIQYILMKGSEPVGQIRFSVKGEDAEIGYSIDSAKRGKGYGERIISLALEKMQTDYPEVKRFIAKVKPGNSTSVRCFDKNGFKETFRQYEIRKV